MRQEPTVNQQRDLIEVRTVTIMPDGDELVSFDAYPFMHEAIALLRNVASRMRALHGWGSVVAGMYAITYSKPNGTQVRMTIVMPPPEYEV